MPGVPTKEGQQLVCSQIRDGTFTFPPNVPGPVVPSGTNAPGGTFPPVPTGGQCADMTKIQTCSPPLQADLLSAASTRDFAKCTQAVTAYMSCLGPCR